MPGKTGASELVNKIQSDQRLATGSARLHRMTKHKYIMSFTTGGLFYNESIKIVSVFLQIHDWDAVREKVLIDNLLQTRTIAAAKRICREIVFRLRLLSDEEIRLLVEGSRQDQVQVLWVAVCRRYKLIKEFMVEVVREKYLGMDYQLKHEDYDKFYNRKAEWNAGLEHQTAATQKKQRQVLFRMMQEADLLTKDNTITGQIFAPRFVKVMSNSKQEIVDMFPVNGSAFQGVA
ncbi:MAG: DUF1819 family protein [Deltaproteobacteria bacterium]|nr:DUF1819 family protein [Deltaproteobacteria bacterium]